MKSLSLKQPWAELVIQGKKSIELRKWKTSFKGEFYVHASGNQEEAAYEIALWFENHEIHSYKRTDENI